jgi:hypothetical protein
MNEGASLRLDRMLIYCAKIRTSRAAKSVMTQACAPRAKFPSHRSKKTTAARHAIHMLYVVSKEMFEMILAEDLSAK